MLDETNALCDRIKAIVDDANAILQSESLAEKRKQLREISGVTEKLQRTGVPVPQELLNLSDSLSQDVAQQDAAQSALRTLHVRLSEILRQTAARFGERPVRRRRHRLDLDGCTPVDEYRRVIVEILQALGGRAYAHDVLQAISERMSDALTPRDLEEDERNGQEMWRISAKKARGELVREGVLRSDSPKKTWELSDRTSE